MGKQWSILRFNPVAGDPNNFIDLPSMNLGPSQMVDVDLEPLKGAISGRSDLTKSVFRCSTLGRRVV
jgi:hypothetical protein